MTWLLPPTKLGRSLAHRVNFVWKHGSRPIYVMDNHRAALWCWAQEIALEDPWSIVHVDRHWDLGSIPQKDIDRAASNSVLSGSLPSFLSQNSVVSPTNYLVRWDNYIEPFFRARPNFKQGFLHARQDPNATRLPALRQAHPCLRSYAQPDEFVAQAGFAIRSEEDIGKTVVNIDLDYLFADSNLGYCRLIHKDFSCQLADFFDPINTGQNLGVATICLSPECCGGWTPAIDALKELFSCQGRFPELDDLVLALEKAPRE